MIGTFARRLRHCLIGVLVVASIGLGSGLALAGLPETIARIKPSVVVVGTFNKLRSPQFVMRGTGFAVGDGTLIATNAHVIGVPEDGSMDDALVVLTRSGSESRPREARLIVRDIEHDLAVLRISGPPLLALTLRPPDTVREGQAIAFTGFPIGGALGFSPVTHRGVIASITPIVLPGSNAQELKDKSVRRLRSGAFPIFQLDATAYPGNSGGPLYDAESGDVLGIVNMVLVKATKEAVLEKPSGISYAIPAGFLIALLGRIKP